MYKAINFLQRNRNWADGILFIPMSWAKYQWTIKETLDLISIPAAFVFFDPPFDFGTPVSDSILNNKKVDHLVAHQLKHARTLLII